MAVMYPPEWRDINGSAAERHVYRRLRDETPDDWYGVHSVGLTSHRYKSWAEADFVVVGPFGVLCIEVKGGVVAVKDGVWSTNGNRLDESPFRQAGGAAAALRRDLRDLFPSLRRVIVEAAVAFPDCEFVGRGAGIEPAILYDGTTVGGAFQAWVADVVRYWRTRAGLDDERFRPLSRAERSAVVGWLAPSVTAVPSLRSRLADVEAEIVELTRLQARVLRGMQTKRRALIRGGAGTGKTLLAAEEATRLAMSGARVLFCCRSPFLAAHLQTVVEGDGVEVRSLEALMWELVDRAGARGRVRDAHPADVFAVFLPEVAAEAAIDLGITFDALVVDEAQDLLLETVLDVFDVLLDGGLSEGIWRFFLDHRQNVFSAVDQAQLDRLEQDAVTELDLVDNCRNSGQIAVTTALLSAVRPDQVSAPDGPDVDLRFVPEHRRPAVEAAEMVLDWLSMGIDADDLMILGAGAGPAIELEQVLSRHGRAPTRFPERTPGRPTWCPIEDFKGLEASAIVITDIQDLDDRETLRRVYVGCSRARTMLGIVLPERTRASFELRATEFARMFAERVT